MNAIKSPTFSERVRTAVKGSPLLFAMLRPCVDAFRHARHGHKARNLQHFRRACVDAGERALAPFFVKVGANDGITGDPCSDLLLAGKWKGLLVEPVPYCLARLAENFSDRGRFTLSPAAIGARHGTASFFYVDARAKEAIPELPFYYDQLGSFDRGHILKHLGGTLEPFVLERAVEVTPLSNLLARHQVAEVHLLHVDVEGFDLEVLKTLDFTLHAPAIVYIEHKHLSPDGRSEMQDILRANGYTVNDCGDDFFALHEARFARIGDRKR
jgi:FkbM family methyltransferase